MNLYLRHIALNLITVCVLFKIGWAYRDSGHSYHQGQHPPPGFGSGNINTNNNNCPVPRPFPPNAEKVKVMPNVPLECLPSYLLNPNAVLDDDDGTTEWAGGQKPDYSVVTEMFNRERSIVHPRGSLEDMMANLMKNWDKELHYKTNPRQWVTLVPSDNFYIINNGGPRLPLPEVFRLGSYNMFLGNSEFYSKDYLNSSAADEVFRNALVSGFVLEVLEVYSPPPRVVFKFRHWGHMTGPLRCPNRSGNWLNVPPHGKRVEFFGETVLNLNEKYQILNVENTFRGDTLMEQMVLGTANVPNRASIGSSAQGGAWSWK